VREYLKKLTIVVAMAMMLPMAYANEAKQQTPTTTSEIGHREQIVGKPGAPIAMEYSLKSMPKKGKDLDVDLTFTSLSALPGTLTVKVHGGRGLRLVSDKRPVDFAVQNLNETHGRTVTVNANKQGLFYINVITKLTTSDKKHRQRTFAVPIQIGQVDSRPIPPGKVLEDSTGQKIMSLPAEEIE